MRARILPWQALTTALTSTCLIAALATISSAQTAPAHPKAEPGQPIDAYIHAAWDTLSRSMDECKSVVDTKLATASILYLPANVPEPPEIAALEKSCNVKVDRLPR